MVGGRIVVCTVHYTVRVIPKQVKTIGKPRTAADRGAGGCGNHCNSPGSISILNGVGTEVFLDHQGHFEYDGIVKLTQVQTG